MAQRYEHNFLYNVCSATTLAWFTRIGSNATDKWLNAVCITRNFAYACWLLRDFSDQGKIRGWMTRIFIAR